MPPVTTTLTTVSPKSSKPRKPQHMSPTQVARRAAAAEARKARVRKRWAIASALLVAVLLVGVFAVVGGDDDPASVDSGTSTSLGPATSTTASPGALAPVPAGLSISGDTPCPKADGSSPRTSSFAKAPPMCIDPARRYTAVFDTTEGPIEVALDAAATPGTVNNFVVLSRYHYYDGSAVHRTDTSIDILQGGAPSTQSASDPGPGYTIADEGTTDRHYAEGDLVMARTGAPNSAGAQYFFVAGPKASALDSTGTYVTFGKVSAGLDVVKAILALHQAGGSLGGAPSRPVIVSSVTINES